MYSTAITAYAYDRSTDTVLCTAIICNYGTCISVSARYAQSAFSLPLDRLTHNEALLRYPGKTARYLPLCRATYFNKSEVVFETTATVAERAVTVRGATIMRKEFVTRPPMLLRTRNKSSKNETRRATPSHEMVNGRFKCHRSRRRAVHTDNARPRRRYGITRS